MQENGLKMICMKTGNTFKKNNKKYIYKVKGKGLPITKMKIKN